MCDSWVVAALVVGFDIGVILMSLLFLAREA